MMNTDDQIDFENLTKATGNAIRQRKGHNHVQTASKHIEILRQHGKRISALQTMTDFYARLAEPATTGGVVVILERPSGAEQLRYGGGYYSVLHKTKTLREVERLVSLATHRVLSIHDVTILDAFPLQPDDNFNDQDPRESSKLLLKLLSAKRPDLVISCFRAGNHQGVIRLLQHPGVGSEFNNQYLPISAGQHEFKKVDAFHPSFAVSYHADEICFIQLLELQFAKGFGEWCGTWREACWMDKLREEARGRKLELSAERTTDKASASNTSDDQVQQMISRLEKMSITRKPPADQSHDITIGKGITHLRISGRLLAQAKSMHAENSELLSKRLEH